MVFLSWFFVTPKLDSKTEFWIKLTLEEDGNLFLITALLKSKCELLWLMYTPSDFIEDHSVLTQLGMVHPNFLISLDAWFVGLDTSLINFNNLWIESLDPHFRNGDD